jgi:acyl transferase domain-containing protein
VEPIAVVGLGCRFPGAPDGPKSFWRLLQTGIDAITEMTPDRLGRDVYYRAHQADASNMKTRWGGFLEDVDCFDAAFFRISPREALRMDPQQRLLLEVAWEALEDSGQVVEQLAGSDAGVFIGISTFDYGALQLGCDPVRLDDPYAGTGSALSIAANRLSYAFDFRGPSLSVDTACSSSLVAVHLACQHLRTRECDLALAGGVNLILAPAFSTAFDRAGLLADDGRCKAFDARADGYCRGEGCGIVVLKRLADAVAAGEPIRAVIRGSAVNQNGRGNGLTAPSRWSQIAVLQAAYRAASIAPSQVQYVEAHGLGTRLGDPIEAAALGSVLSHTDHRERDYLVGSVKTNIGHLEAAAGIASLIKVVLALQHREIPPSLHFRIPNPHIPFDVLRLRVQQQLGPWPPAGEVSGSRIAGVSAFGFGGTNAHVVVEEAASSSTHQV